MISVIEMKRKLFLSPVECNEPVSKTKKFLFSIEGNMFTAEANAGMT